MVSEDVVIRAASTSDAETLATIYNHYVAHTAITFEEIPVPVEDMARRVHDVQAAELPWLVADEKGQLLGYAYATPWKARSAYRFSVETTVYLAPQHVGRGLGSMLYRALLPILEARGIHAVIGGVALPNPASVALHEKLGFEKVAHFRQVGRKFDQWIDVGYWQRLLKKD